MKGGAKRKSTSFDRPPPPRNDLGTTEHNGERQQQQQQQQVLVTNDGGGGDRYEDEEEEEYDEDFEDQSGDLENEGEGDANGEDVDERPKLAEGYFEIESVRKKRSRKGKIQYLIKWRGWPETSNTWEPVENLMSCSDIIDAFEERMRPGKQRSYRKHKRKNAVSIQPPAKKKKQPHQQQPHQQPPHQQQPHQQQQQGSPAATYDVPSVKLKIIEEPSPDIIGNDPSCSKWADNNVKGMRNVRKPNGSLSVSQKSEKLTETDELNLKLSELKSISSTDKENINGSAVNIQENRSSEGVSVSVSPSNGISDVNGQNGQNGQNPVWVSRSGGAKRRKSGTVKRFKKDLGPTKDVQDGTERLAGGTGSVVVEHRVQNYEPMGNGYSVMNVVDTSKSMYAITKVIKPIEYSISTINDMQDILVTFLVLRSDGKEVMVDNRYLKAHYPLLLINFYEQNIQYTSPSE